MKSSAAQLSANVRIFKLCANVHLNQRMSKTSWAVVYVSWALNVVQLLAAVADIIFNGLDNLERLAENLPMTMATIMLTYEFYNVIGNKSKIEELMGLLDETSRVQPDHALLAYKECKMKALLPKIDKFGLIYLSFTLLATEAWVLSPLLQTDRPLPFPGSWYPFDITKHYYFVPWAIQAYICNIGATNTTNIYLFYVKIIAIICEHFDYLSHSLSHLDFNGNGEKEALERLKGCVRYHCMIRRCCEQLQVCMGGILACQCLVGACECFAAFAMSDQFNLNMLNHILIELLQLYLYFWFSDNLTSYSENMSRELFYSPWYKYKAKVRKHFLLIMRGAERPFVLRAGGLVPVLLRIYLKLMQQSYSFLMVLINLNK